MCSNRRASVSTRLLDNRTAYGSTSTTAIMPKVLFAGGVGHREMLRANTLPSITRAKIGCFARIGIHEENARFILLALLLLFYLCFGAALFNYLERENEIQEKQKYATLLKSVRASLCKDNEKQCDNLDRLLELNANLSAAGLLSKQQRFDISGAFFFAGTVISTIGFGMSTPRTAVGRLATILYGVLGCACCVLFFNLFLERLITVLTYTLRYWHEKKLKRRQRLDSAIPVVLSVNDMNGSSTSLDGGEEFWRPSVYKVFVILFALCAIFMFGAAYFYSATEGWSYVDSLYFCFTGFATIGFGDFVPNQQASYKYSLKTIRIANFLILSLGASSVYCLFNVSSIVIRQLLNWLIKHMDIKIHDSMCCWRRKPKRYVGLGLRPPPGYDTSERSSLNSNGEGLLSLKDFLMNNQNSVVLLQKQLIKCATKKASNEEKITANRVGPMGMLNEAFGDI
ncbi:Potassium channel subfamily K member 13 [Toxocara canis]|uniref:Potassium channel subfamily K member 13 n=1 Tax=Toxocara canis TaxID=6265 RepID=A0A0B2W0F8_TOXCA|nr:Potassium channel subfamily K member 13 [Toxocara canis]